MPGDLPDRARSSQLQRGGAEAPPRLLASWQRSEDYGVPAEGIEPVFTGTEVSGSLFFECGSQVLADLRDTLAGEPVSAMLTDADGVVLHRISGDHSLETALDRVHLAPGFAYSEREVGTNGLGLALADRVPTVVHADEHYSESLRTFTCAAVPVLDPVTGRLEGSVNLTTLASAPAQLLLAVARSAASNTTALMLARTSGRRARPTPRGQVFRAEMPRLEPGSGTLHSLSQAWTVAAARTEAGLDGAGLVAAVGEPGCGRGTLIAQAARHRYPQHRILSAAPPGAADIETWLGLWGPELGKPYTAVVVRDVDTLPAWAAERLRDLVVATRQGALVPFGITAERFEDIPAALAPLVGTVVAVPPLRERQADILPLAAHIASRRRGREVAFTPSASRALQNYEWPGNVEQLATVVGGAARGADLIDIGDLPSEVLAGTTRRLSRIEIFERGEIARVLSDPATTMNDAARELGMSRATLYRKIGQYGIQVTRG